MFFLFVGGRAESFEINQTQILYFLATKSIIFLSIGMQVAVLSNVEKTLKRRRDWKLSAFRQFGCNRKIRSTAGQSCGEIKPFNVHDEVRLFFACRHSVCYGLAERCHATVGWAEGKIGDRFFEATATAGNDRTRHNPGTVI